MLRLNLKPVVKKDKVILEVEADYEISFWISNYSSSYGVAILVENNPMRRVTLNLQPGLTEFGEVYFPFKEVVRLFEKFREDLQNLREGITTAIKDYESKKKAIEDLSGEVV